MKKFKNTSGKDLFLRGFGLIKSGEIIKTKKEIKNVNIVEIKEEVIKEEKHKFKK